MIEGILTARSNPFRNKIVWLASLESLTLK
jgi:hypothetical protein